MDQENKKLYLSWIRWLRHGDDKLSTTLLSYSCWSSVYTAGALTSICDAGGGREHKGFVLTRGPCDLLLTVPYYILGPDYGDNPCYTRTKWISCRLISLKFALTSNNMAAVTIRDRPPCLTVRRRASGLKDSFGYPEVEKSVKLDS